MPQASGCTESAADDSIRVTFTVPDGWAGIGGTIWRAVENNSPPGGAGLLFAEALALFTRHSCKPQPTAHPLSTGTTVAEFVDALVQRTDLDVTGPVDVTLGGTPGSTSTAAAANIAANQAPGAW